MSKSIGYILTIIGAIGVLLSFETVQKTVNVTLPASFSNNYLMIAGVVILLIGLMMSFGKKGLKGGKQASEVPIYQDNRIIGYRRV